MEKQVSGHGLALAAVTLEQDSAYFEVHVELKNPNKAKEEEAEESSVEIMVGVATRKDRKFYNENEEKDALHHAEEEQGEAGACILLMRTRCGQQGQNIFTLSSSCTRISHSHASHALHRPGKQVRHRHPKQQEARSS